MQSDSATSPQPAVDAHVPLGQLAAVGGASFLVIAFLARFPLAMLQLGALLYANARFDSFSVGGLMVAAMGIGGAVFGPFAGRLADRYGQRRIGVGLAILQAVLLTAFLISIESGVRTVIPLAAGIFCVGAVNPQIGPLSRTRWASMARSRPNRNRLVSAAMAYEAVADEMSFVLGPMAVGAIAGLVDPAAAMFSALVIGLVFQLAFALHPTAVGPAGHQVDLGRPQSVNWLQVVPLVTAVASVGLVFGSTQTGIAAWFDGLGQGVLTGLVYGCVGAGSAVAGLLVVNRLPERFRLPVRIMVFGAGLGVLALLLNATRDPILLAAVCFTVGLMVAPVLISSYSAAERLVPPRAAAMIMTVLAMATAVGVSLGVAGGGWLVDNLGVHAALLVPVGAGALAAVSGMVATWQTRQLPPPPDLRR
ncbi:MAG: MFS transporter [Propionibacteriales bacterium]|nr:MFS transporter [Propionibacteriales bacterium]